MSKKAAVNTRPTWQNQGLYTRRGRLCVTWSVTYRENLLSDIAGEHRQPHSEYNAPKGFGAVDIIDGFAVPEAGIYPFRLVSGQSVGAASLEWFSILPDDTKVLD